jgi:hypothetical protein
MVVMMGQVEVMVLVEAENVMRDEIWNMDTFGMNGSEWNVYRERRVKDDGGDESEDNLCIDETRLESICEKINEIAPDDEDPTMTRAVGSEF